MQTDEFSYASQGPGREPAAVGKTRRWLNHWSFFGLLALSALAIVLFVANAIAVNKLVEEVNELTQKRDHLIRENDLLRAEIIRLQSPDRITEFARDKLGMIQAEKAPRRLNP